jgi:hypothetical protein
MPYHAGANSLALAPSFIAAVKEKSLVWLADRWLYAVW